MASSLQGKCQGWEAGYAEYLAQEKETDRATVAFTHGKEETWEEQYAAYCTDKEATLQEQELKQMQ